MSCAELGSSSRTSWEAVRSADVWVVYNGKEVFLQMVLAELDLRGSIYVWMDKRENNFLEEREKPGQGVCKGDTVH